MTEKKSSRQRYYQGKYRPINREKILGNPDNIVYRSGWERDLMKKFDTSPDVLKWGSEVEGQHIWYKSPVDGQKHRYFPDFILVTRSSSNVKGHDVSLLEVKPYGQCFPPQQRGKKKVRYVHEVKTYLVNQAKWRAAREWATARGWVFKVVTEQGVLEASEAINEELVF